jgi:hypothetical protein
MALVAARDVDTVAHISAIGDTHVETKLASRMSTRSHAPELTQRLCDKGWDG